MNIFEKFIQEKKIVQEKKPSQYINAESIPSTVVIGTILISDIKIELKGDYNPKEKYKLGDIVKFKENHYLNLFKGIAKEQSLPNDTTQWKIVKINFNIIEDQHLKTNKPIVIKKEPIIILKIDKSLITDLKTCKKLKDTYKTNNKMFMLATNGVDKFPLDKAIELKLLEYFVAVKAKTKAKQEDDDDDDDDDDEDDGKSNKSNKKLKNQETIVEQVSPKEVSKVSSVKGITKTSSEKVNPDCIPKQFNNFQYYLVKQFPKIIYKDQKVKFQKLVIDPKFSGIYNSSIKYKLGDIVQFNDKNNNNIGYFVNKIINGSQMNGLQIVNYSFNQSPTFNQFNHCWERINYFEKPVNYNSDDLYEFKLPSSFLIGQIISDPRYPLKIKAEFKNYNALEKFQLGDIIRTDNGKFFGSLLKSKNFQEYPDFNKKNKNLGKDLLKKGWQLVTIKITELRLESIKLPSEFKIGEKFEYLPRNDLNNIKFTTKFKQDFNNKKSYDIGNVVIFNKKFYIYLYYKKIDKKKKSPKDIKKTLLDNPDKDSVNWKEIKLLPTVKIMPAKQIPGKVRIGVSQLPKPLISLKNDFLNKIAGEYDSDKKYRLGDIVNFNNKLYINLIFSYTFDNNGKRIFLDSESKDIPSNDKAWKLIQLDELPARKDKFENTSENDSLFKSFYNLFNNPIKFLNW